MTAQNYHFLVHFLVYAGELGEKLQEENDKLRKQIEKLERKRKMEMITMKEYLAESKLPGSALPPVYKEDDFDGLSYPRRAGMES